MIYNIGDTELAPSKNYGKFSSLPIFLGRVSRVSTIDHVLMECSFKCYDYSHEVRPKVRFLLDDAIFSKIWTEIAREKRTTASFFSTPKPSEICWQNLKNVVPSTGKLQKTGPKSHKSAFLMPSSWKVRFFINLSHYTLFESCYHPDYKYLGLICWIDLYVEKSPAD